MNTSLTIHFIWWTFYGQFHYIDCLLRELLGLTGGCLLNNVSCWNGEYLCLPSWLFLITGLLWDYLLLMRLCRLVMRKEDSDILDY